MKFIWISYIVEILVLSLIQPHITNFEGIAVIAVLVHVIFSMITLFLYDKKIRYIILLGYLLRVFILFWDLYARDTFSLPNSGADSEMFYRMSLLISENLSMLGSTRGGRYSDVMGIIFSLVGPQRLFGQYLNVLLGTSTVLIINKILNNLDISIKTKQLVLLLTSFFPNSIIFSGIFLREMFPTFFVAVSLFYFVLWFKKSNLKYIILAFIFLGLASTFHSGVLGLALGYIFSFLFYNKKTKKLQFSLNTIIAFIIILGIFILSFTVLNEYLFGKFANIEGIEDIYETATPSGAGDAAYLKGLEINNLSQFIIYSPLKSIYFLMSPVPWDWRGIFDVFTFFFDSMFYLTVFYLFIKHKKTIKKHRPLAIALLIMIIGAIFIFGVGVSNAGTAMRHRQKILPVFSVLLGVIINSKKNYNGKIL